jgi:WD40 repeat protein
MAESDAGGRSAASAERAERDRILDAFEDAWVRGERPDVAAFVAEGPGRWAVLLELIHIDLERRLKVGLAARVEDYLGRFAQLAGDRPAVLDLAAREYDLRRRAEPGLDPQEYRRRFPDLTEELAAHVAGLSSLPVGDSFVTVPPGSAPVSMEVPAPAGYEVLGELGRGGMGVVYKARQVGLNRIVALKMVLAGGHAGPDELGRFQREAEALARLQHPNIVQVFEVGQHEGRPFFSLELCPGGGLDKKLAGTPVEPKQAARWVETLARAMHAAHQANVVHRDLKPANVLLAADGTLKVTDFGLARRLDEAGHTATGAVMGTPSYMAPEQAAGKGKQVGPAADVYALGAILYECLTGRPPFKAANPLDTLVQVVSDEPVPVRRLQPKVPRDVETICLKCLRKEPGKRYASAAMLAEDLRRFSAGEPIQARPVGQLERAWRWCRRNPVLAGAASLAAIGLILTAVLGVAAARNARAAALADRERADGDRERLWQSLIEQARAERQAGNPWRAIERIAEAAEIKANDDLRTEAIQAITSPGVRLVEEVSGHLEENTSILDRFHELRFSKKEPAGHVLTFDPGGASGKAKFLTERTTQVTEVIAAQGLLSEACSAARIPQVFSVLAIASGMLHFQHFYELPKTWSDDHRLRVFALERRERRPDVFVWDAVDQKVVTRLPAHIGLPAVFGISNDGRWLAFRDSIDADMIRVWDCRRHRFHGRLEGQREVAMWTDGTRYMPASFSSAKYSPDGTLLASTHLRAGQPVVQIDDLSSCRIVRTLPGVITDLWSDDGRCLVTSSSTSFLGAQDATREAASSDVVRRFRGLRLDNDHRQLRFSQAWEVACPVPTYRVGEEISRLTFRPDGKQLAVNGSVWNVLPGAARTVLEQTTAEAPGAIVAFSGPEIWATRRSSGPPRTPYDGSRAQQVAARVVVAGAESAAGLGVFSAFPTVMATLPWEQGINIRLVRLAPTPKVLTLEPLKTDGMIKSLFQRWAADRERSARENERKEFDWYRNWLLGPITTEPVNWIWSPDGKKLLVIVRANLFLGYQTDRLATWDRHTGAWRILKSALHFAEGWFGSGPWRAAAFDPTGRWFVICALNGNDAQLWDATREVAIRKMGPPSGNHFHKVAWSGNGKYFLAVSKQFRLLKPDGSFQEPPKAIVFDTKCAEARSWPAPPSEWTACALSADGRWAISGGEDGLLRIRDIETGKELARWQAHEAAVTALTFSPDGKLLVSGARDGTLRVWNIPWIRGDLAKLSLDW